MSQELLVRIDVLRAKLNEAWTILRLDDVRDEFKALEIAAASPDIWNDPESARKTLQKLSETKQSFDGWNTLRMQLLEVEELARLSMEEPESGILEDLSTQLDVWEKAYLQKEFELLFSGKYDERSAIMAIHAGAGGTDAQDWAEMLLRMYVRFSEKNGWSVRLVDESRGGEAGIKSVTMFITGRHVYGYLRGEAGVHRLVRQSPFNADGLRQTSFALVEVLPEIDETVAVDIKPDDLRVDTFMSGGKGGQSVNTTYSAVRIVHLPTGITVSCQNERSQTQNKAVAMNILRAKLLKLKEEEQQKEKQNLRGAHQSAEWGSQIRSYVLHPYKMVKDHRTDVETADAEGVLEGNLDAFVEGELRWAAKEK
ncbi:peptide chain release factor 2 [Patescibacteria group bacterium]|nr:peptide chain release factor 2 [Patescibacteria group bacterium]